VFVNFQFCCVEHRIGNWRPARPRHGRPSCGTETPRIRTPEGRGTPLVSPVKPTPWQSVQVRHVIERFGVRRAFAVAAALAMLVLLTGCDSPLDRPTIPQTAAVTVTPTTTTPVSITPVTPDGLLTGPGVTDETITLGLLVDLNRDRGFIAGVELWQQAVNSSGGLCGRTVQLATTGTTNVPADPVEAYDAAAFSTLGLITLAPPDESVALYSRIAADQIPALTPSGSSAQLGPSRPIVIGPTQDVLAINALDYVDQQTEIQRSGPVGVLTDQSTAAENALLGARWWAREHDVSLDVRTFDEQTELADWGAATTVLALTDSTATGKLAGAVPSNVTILTTIDGYDPATWDEQALAAATAGRVLVSTGTPAYGSDYPAAVAVASRAAAAGQADPGPRLLDGYATGSNWARLLVQACGERTLTRLGISQAVTSVGPAASDSLYGPTDPGLPVLSALPATRVSAMSAADPAAPTGLRPLTGLESASGIEDYVP
jgi:hypothetical protein